MEQCWETYVELSGCPASNASWEAFLFPDIDGTQLNETDFETTGELSAIASNCLDEVFLRSHVVPFGTFCTP